MTELVGTSKRKIEYFNQVRGFTDLLVKPLLPEDFIVQAMEDVSLA